MALVVEDGTGKADAESYISVSDASTYHTARGNAAWAALASDTLREQALRKATAYMLQCYRQGWKGMRAFSTQALDWPRVAVVVDNFVLNGDTVPADVANACAELALRAASAALTSDLTQAKVSTKVGPIEVEYDPSSARQKQYTAVDRMLAPYMTSSGSTISLVRA